MLRQLLYAGTLLGACVVVHAMMLAVLLRWLTRPGTALTKGFGSTTWLLVRMAWWIVLAHLLEISIWAVFYTGQALFPDFQSAVYFSVVTYTTVGYGDLVPPESWRLAAGIEGLTGILMCGLSGAFFFAALARFNSIHVAGPPKTPKQ